MFDGFQESSAHIVRPDEISIQGLRWEAWTLTLIGFGHSIGSLAYTAKWTGLRGIGRMNKVHQHTVLLVPPQVVLFTLCSDPLNQKRNPLRRQ